MFLTLPSQTRICVRSPNRSEGARGGRGTTDCRVHRGWGAVTGEANCHPHPLAVVATCAPGSRGGTTLSALAPGPEESGPLAHHRGIAQTAEHPKMRTSPWGRKSDRFLLPTHLPLTITIHHSNPPTPPPKVQPSPTSHTPTSQHESRTDFASCRASRALSPGYPSAVLLHPSMAQIMWYQFVPPDMSLLQPPKTESNNLRLLLLRNHSLPRYPLPNAGRRQFPIFKVEDGGPEKKYPSISYVNCHI